MRVVGPCGPDGPDTKAQSVLLYNIPAEYIHVARHRGKTNGEVNRRTPDDGNAIANSALKVSTRVDVTRFISTRTSKCLCSPVALERSLPAMEVRCSRFLYGRMPPDVGQGMLWEGGLKGA
jgi:hypothetical protein